MTKRIEGKKCQASFSSYKNCIKNGINVNLTKDYKKVFISLLLAKRFS